jgi:archaetidylinositol phosphate synthase
VDLRYPVTRYVYRPVSLRVAAKLAGTRVTPLHVTLISGVFTVGGGVAFGFGAYVVGALLILIGVITDCVDGDLARMTNTTSRTGAFLDSVLDRWTDAALIVGLAFSDLEQYGGLAAFALSATMLVSYTRARAQSLGVDCPDGIGARDTRILILVCAALFGQIALGLWLVLIAGAITTLQRMWIAARALHAADVAALSEAPLSDPAEDRQ